MAFQLIGPNQSTSIDDLEDGIFELPQRYGRTAAFLPQIQSLFYESSVIQASSVPQLKAEIEGFLADRRSEIEGPIQRNKGIHPSTMALQPRLIERYLLEDPTYRTLAGILEVCDDCIAHDQDLACEGD